MMIDTNRFTLSKNRGLYKFQQTVRDIFLDSENVILQAPTGSGKTRASMLPALIGFASDKTSHPQQLIYGVPMRVLANSFMNEFSKIAQTNSRWTRHHWLPSIQTGEHPGDNLFERQIIFATVDQMLASFLNIPYGIPKKLDNINAGAFIGSYLIFDEVHLYPSRQMFLSVLAMLKMLEGITRFTLMSATLTPDLIQAISKLLNAQAIYEDSSIPLTQGMFRDISHLQEQERTWIAKDGDLTADEILHALKEGNRILCICNTVDRAQDVYRQLKLLEPENTDCVLLHSRFYQKHRADHEKQALSWLGNPDSSDYVDDGRRKVVITTQVVEVGLDISADVLLTECAPAASLIQRAGRCVRWRGRGQVWVYQPSKDSETNKINYAPYLDDGLEDVCEKTWDTLTQSEFNHQILQYHKEQQLVEKAHGDHDQEQLINGLEINVENRIEAMLECMRTRDEGYIDSLIRKKENSSATLYIMADRKNEQLTHNLNSLDGLNVSKGRLWHLMKEITTDAPFVLATANEVEDEYEEEGQLKTQTIHRWDHTLHSENEVYQYRIFVAHPDVIGYTSEQGLFWNNDGEPATESIVKPPKTGYQSFGYDADTYIQHIRGLYRAYSSNLLRSKGYRALKDQHQYAILQLLQIIRPNETWDTVDYYIRLMLALHDVGKLNKRWQNWALKRHQLFIERHQSEVPTDGTPLAHTTKGWQKFPSLQDEKSYEKAFRALRVSQRGSHAVESAEAVSDLVWLLTEGDWFWYSVIISAICHHHTPTADTCKDFRIVDNADPSLIEALTVCGFDKSDAIQWAGQIKPQCKRHSRRLSEAIKKAKPSRQEYGRALMYYLFVRILRLADQRSFAYIHTNEKE